MARYISKFALGLQQVSGKHFKFSSYETRISIRNLSQKSKYTPVKLAYQLCIPKCGADERLSPLIFLHGLGSTSKVTWGDIPQMAADQTERIVYNLDARNHGDSEWSDEFDFDLNVIDLLHFVDEKSFSKVVIVGHSMGGITGIKAALRAPEKIEMLFTEDVAARKLPQSFLDYGIGYMSLWREAEQFIPSGVDEEEANSFVTEYVRCKTKPQNQFADSRLLQYEIAYPLGKDSSERYVFKVNLEVILEKMKNAEAMMSEPEGIYNGPSYFLYGTKSAFQISKDKHQILQHFPKAVLVPFETSRHFFHKKFHDLFVKTIVKFIKQNEKHL